MVFKSIIGVVSVCLAVSSEAFALSISQNISFDHSNYVYDYYYQGSTVPISNTTTSNQYYNFDRFDSSLGELTSVSVTYNSSYDHVTKAYATDYGSADYYENMSWQQYSNDWYKYVREDASINTTGHAYNWLGLYDPSLAGDSDADYNYGADCSADVRTGYDFYYNNQPDNFSAYGSAVCSDTESDLLNDFSGALNIDSSSFYLFETDYSSSLGSLRTYEYNSIAGNCDTDTGSYCNASTETAWSGNIVVTYEYTATSVPEPSILALMSAGLVGLGFVRNRKKKA